jgi:hypothetical protein
VQLVWGRGPYLAWSARSAAPSVSLFNPSTGGHQTVPGWRALCWSPDGTDLLVTNDRHLGVIELPDVTAVHDLGAQPVSPITGCAWES